MKDIILAGLAVCGILWLATLLFPFGKPLLEDSSAGISGNELWIPIVALGIIALIAVVKKSISILKKKNKDV